MTQLHELYVAAYGDDDVFDPSDPTGPPELLDDLQYCEEAGAYVAEELESAEREIDEYRSRPAEEFGFMDGQPF